MLKNMCLMGIIPLVGTLTSKHHNILTRLYSAHFIHKVINTPETLPTFISCGGFQYLGDMLVVDGDAESSVELIQLSVDCMTSILRIHGQVISTTC